MIIAGNIQYLEIPRNTGGVLLEKDGKIELHQLPGYLNQICKVLLQQKQENRSVGVLNVLSATSAIVQLSLAKSEFRVSSFKFVP